MTATRHRSQRVPDEGIRFLQDMPARSKVGLWAHILGLGLALLVSVVIGATEYGTFAFVGMLSIIMTVAILLKPQIGLYVLILAVYSNISWVFTERFGTPGINKALIALLLVSVLATRLILHRKPLIFRWTEASILAYIVLAIISTFAGEGVNANSFGNVLDLAKDFCIVVIVVQLSGEENVWKTAQILLIACAVGVSILSWYQGITGDYDTEFMGFAQSRMDSVQEDGDFYIDIRRSNGPIGDPNFYGQILLMVYPIAAYRFFGERRLFQKLLGLAATAIIAGAIVFTFSRGAMLVLVGISGLILLERGFSIYKIAALGVVGLLILAPVLPAGYTERMLTVVGIGEPDTRPDVSMRGRTSEALVALEMFKDNPVLGIGYGMYEENYLDYSVDIGLDSRLEERQAHSLYLEALAETGLLGAILLFTMLCIIFRALYRARQRLIQIERHDLIPWVVGLAFGLLAYLVSSILLHDDFARYLRLSIALAVSATVLVDNLVEREKSVPTGRRVI